MSRWQRVHRPRAERHVEDIMQGRFVQLSVVTAAIGLLVAATPAAAPKPKAPADVPGSFSLRSPCDVGGIGPDRISGDCLSAYEADTNGTYVILNTNREFRAALFGDRYLQLDFAEQVSDGFCGTNCFRQFQTLVIPTANTYPPEGPYRVVMQTNVLSSEFGTELANGLLDVTSGTPRPARFFVSFKDPNGRDFHWSALFNPQEYAGSSYVTVNRTGACSWTIAADANAFGTRAGLRAWNVNKGRNGNSDEGVFLMQFEIAFTAPNCGA